MNIEEPHRTFVWKIYERRFEVTCDGEMFAASSAISTFEQAVADMFRLSGKQTVSVSINLPPTITPLQEILAAAEQMHTALQQQHIAIDMLFALLIQSDCKFFPSKSGPPWDAVQLGNAARAAWQKVSKG